MKKFFGLKYLLLIQVLAFCLLVACSAGAEAASSGPNLEAATEVVENFLTHLQSGEYIEAQELVYGPLFVFDIEEEFWLIFDNLQYAYVVVEVASNETDPAIIASVEVSNVDFMLVMESVMEEAFYWIFTDITQLELTQRVQETLAEKLSDLDAQRLTSQLSFEVEEYEGSWRLLLDDDFIDAVTGGLLSFSEYAGDWQIGS